ncbi:hypothetical protein DSCO28_71940 [Desulfosarcina ovata subsp. sediminis]|uniref:Uncharacterized protein n=1 Tax=Desulfosarcina ovata subsp. sediminis TaxID=885957 RepID=A0A5K8A2K1_9BACT|nr:hypothetical protein [Desulfosarcina ovata]BBO86628.1 hypothetical protein DSCO28_71940 [Desulfosarcina ovata subsp. sediminis]
MAEIISFPEGFDPEGNALEQCMGTEWEDVAMQIYAQARQARIAEIEEQSGQAVRDRIVGLAKIHFGEAEGARFAAVCESGMTESQYRNIRPQLESAGESEELQALRVVKTEIETALSRPAGDSDFMGAVQKTMESEGIGKTAAMTKVARQQPDLHHRFIQSKNPDLEVPK